MPQGTVIFDAVGYKNERGDREYADKGDTVDFTDAEFKRLTGLGAIAKPGAVSEEQAEDAAVSQIAKLGTKDKLVAAAESLGVEVEESATKAEIAQAFIDAGFDADEVSAEIPSD